MTERVNAGGLQVDKKLHDFINDEALPGTGITPDTFWSGFDRLVHDLAPRNRELLDTRDELQRRLDAWYRENRDQPIDLAEYKAVLQEIGYLVPEGGDFAAETANLDPEISTIAGPQLVVPVTNPRYALNAANARWGSLYDALYGTDAIPEDDGAERTGKYNKVRGDRVIAHVRGFLDQAAPSRRAATLTSPPTRSPTAPSRPRSGTEAPPASPTPRGSRGTAATPPPPSSVLLKNNGLHIDIVIDRAHPVGRDDKAGVKDVVLEAATTTIMDLEDSVSTVDAEDKVVAYRNWLGLLKGDLTDRFEKGGRLVDRALNADRTYTAPDGSETTLKGTSLMLIRNVGHLMTNPAILDRDGNEAPEGLLDAMISTVIAVHDLKNRKNSRAGPSTSSSRRCTAPRRSPSATGRWPRSRHPGARPPHPEDRHHGRGAADHRQPEGVHPAAKERVFFINTGFLDRTGDEMHTAMESGPMIRKAEMKSAPWMTTYEDYNVDVGLECGLPGHAQIGKACGPCQTSWPPCSRPRSATPRRAPTPPGCRRPPPPPCTPPTTTRSTSTSARRP